MSEIVSARGVRKLFDGFAAVDGVDLSVRRGECFGLLGPNGAGKSTFISLLYGLQLRDGGDLRVFGMDPSTQSREIKRRLGVVTQENALDEGLTVRENMLLYAGFVGVPRERRKPSVDEGLEFMALAHRADAPIRALSGGMKRRLVFVRALLGEPELVILDEPTTGLDPAVRHLLWGKIREMKGRGATVLLTTHYMHEAEILCDRLVVMNKGRIVAEGLPNDLVAAHTPGFVAVYSSEIVNEEMVRSWTAGIEGSRMSMDSSGYFVRASHLESLVDLQRTSGVPASQIRPANLEDVFLELTGKELSGDA